MHVQCMSWKIPCLLLFIYEFWIFFRSCFWFCLLLLVLSHCCFSFWLLICTCFILVAMLSFVYRFDYVCRFLSFYGGCKFKIVYQGIDLFCTRFIWIKHLTMFLCWRLPWVYVSFNNYLEQTNLNNKFSYAKHSKSVQ